MAFAAMWEPLNRPDSAVLITFIPSIAYANETVGVLHDRMPAIGEPQDSAAWLGEVEGDPAVCWNRPVRGSMCSVVGDGSVTSLEVSVALS
jgi:putative SOS response-associated peptidase YedK